MKKLLLLLACAYSLALQAQTRLIAYKSHSGAAENFSVFINEHLFDADESNFGLPPSVVLDSLILVKKNVAVAVTHHGTEGSSYYKKYDTLRSKKLFNRKTPLDTLKKNIRQLIRFENPADSVHFVGFGNTAPDGRKENRLFYISHKDDRYNPFDGTAVSISLLILLSSLLAGTAAWQWKKKPRLTI